MELFRSIDSAPRLTAAAAAAAPPSSDHLTIEFPPPPQAWQDWRTCLFPPSRHKNVPTYIELAKTFPPKHDTPFHNFLRSAANQGSLPWEAASIGGAGVLIITGKPDRRVLWRSLQNGLDNLPAAWPVYVAGGASALKVVTELFPVEVEVGKIALDDLGDEELNEVSSTAESWDLDLGWVVGLRCNLGLRLHERIDGSVGPIHTKPFRIGMKINQNRARSAIC
jgi:hypothetical protein